MSQSMNGKRTLKKFETNNKVDNNILYSKENLYIEEMKKGYIEMAKLNLQIANECEFDLIDVNMYETWLCGV